MAHSRIMELASQAEKEGITLGELLARDLTSEEMDAVQAELVRDISEGYRDISDFMKDVEVPSIDELLESGPEDWFDLLTDDDYELSDSM
ncbi:MAG: hypothetical protein JW880_08855 [Candidatus Thermoplasmatota archaeon]|nr:hypothetical protein [Candidatus Thermoplasmatota archaeon]